MNRERGITFIEILFVMALAMVVVALSGTVVNDWLQRQAMRGSVYQLQTHLQLTRVQAISRNRACQLVVNEITREIQVFDLMDPGNTTDDVELATVTIDDDVNFDRPDAGSAITLTSLGSNKYGATFDADGTVSAGTGEICLQGADRYDRISVYGAGGIRVERWGGSAWEVGS